MHAIQIHELSGPESVALREVPDPPSTGRVLIDVRAAGVSFPELLQTRGGYQIQPELPFIPGTEVSGVVVEAPAGSRFVAGQRVVGVCRHGGGYAERVALEEPYVLPLPSSVSYVTGAALPMNYLTMHFALARRGRLRAGERVLVHGAAGGIGTAAVHLAAAIGAEVIAVASSEQKRAVARSAGAHHAIPVDGFRDTVAELTRGEGVDVVVDPVGGDRFTDSIRSLRAEGRLLVVGFTDGHIPTVRANRLLLNNVDVVGVGWGAFWASRPQYLAAQWAELTPLIKAGALDPVIDTTMPLAHAAQALRRLEDRAATGKIVLTV